MNRVSGCCEITVVCITRTVFVAVSSTTHFTTASSCFGSSILLQRKLCAVFIGDQAGEPATAQGRAHWFRFVAAPRQRDHRLGGRRAEPRLCDTCRQRRLQHLAVG